MDRSNSIGLRIESLRKGKMLTQAELAKVVGVKRETVVKWESGKTNIKPAKIVELADYFGVSCDYILRDIKRENVDIFRRTGLSDKAIDKLDWLKEASLDTDKLPEIEDKLKKYAIYEMKSDLADADKKFMHLDKEPEKLTPEEGEIYDEYLLSLRKKATLQMLDLLLSNEAGLKIINKIAYYFEIAPAARVELPTQHPATKMVLNSDMISGMYAQEIISALHDYRKIHRGEAIANDKW